MEGVTESCFRDLVLRRNSSECLGGAFTEFARVSTEALPPHILVAHLGPEIHAAPVGLQLMGSNVEEIAKTARRAEEAGALLVDLNFGCSAKGVLNSCAGAALLDDPSKVEELVSACVKAVECIPVTAKIRAGGEDDALLEEIARSVEAGGGDLLTVHCRTRREGYRGDGDWERLRRAVHAVSIPVCGNGGVECHEDIARLPLETGCDFVMIGRAVLTDPWIFSGRRVGRGEAAHFLLEYAELMAERGHMSKLKILGRLKQLIRYWKAGGLFETDRLDWLRERDLNRVLSYLETEAAGFRSCA
jgi:tRNA-dihydrouridine synthase B